MEVYEYLFRVFFAEYIPEINDSADDSKDLHVAAIAEALNLDLYGIGSSKISNVMHAISFSEKICWIEPIRLPPFELYPLVDNLSFICVEDGPVAGCHLEMRCVAF